MSIPLAPIIAFQWTLGEVVAGGESGSLLFDSNGWIFAILLQSDSNSANRGIALNLTEAYELLKIVLDHLVLSKAAARIEKNMRAGSYRNVGDVVPDLKPDAVTNKDLASVIIGISSGTIPATSIRFKHCPVDYALLQRNLDHVYGYWEPDPNTADAVTYAQSQLNRARGLSQSGRSEDAAATYLAVYERISKQSSDKGALIELSSLLGASGQYVKLNEPELAKKYARLSVHKAYLANDRDSVALSSAYLFDAAVEKNDLQTANAIARTAFVQAPKPILDTFSSVDDKEHFRLTYTKLGTEEWKEPIEALKTFLETEIIDKVTKIVAGRSDTPKESAAPRTER